MKPVHCCAMLLLASALCPALAGDAKTDPLAARQGDWICQGGGGHLGREAAVVKIGLPFWNREFRPKITLNVKDDRWTMTFPEGTAKGQLMIKKGDKLNEVDLIIDGKEKVRLLGLTAPLADGQWMLYLNLPGKARPADTVSADFSYAWRQAK